MERLKKEVGYKLFISFNAAILEKCCVLSVKRGMPAAMQIPAIRVSGIPMFLPFLSRESWISAEDLAALTSNGRIFN